MPSINSTSLTGGILEVRDGRPMVRHCGEIVPQAAYRDYIMRGDWEDRIREFAESGVTIFHLRVPCGKQGRATDFFDQSLWMGPDDYPADDSDYSYPLDRQVAEILTYCPEARFYVNYAPHPPLTWIERYPDEVQTDELGRRFRWPSIASEQYLADLTTYLRHMTRYCERKPWGERIVGYLGLPYGEGTTPLTIAGKMFDCSPANEAAFTAWLTARYGSDAALQAAWQDPAVTLATARVPRDAEWLAKRAQGPATIGGQPLSPESVQSNANEVGAGFFHWIEAENALREHDYCRFMRDACARWIQVMSATVKDAAAEMGRARIVGLDVLKQPLHGWTILSTFDGIGDAREFPNMLFFSGSWDAAAMLDDPALDLVWNPADYTARTLGFGHESEGVTESMTVRGKIGMIENDARCYVGAGIQDQGAFRTPAEVKAGLRRNAGMVLSRGLHDYWCNVGSSYFHDAAIQRVIANDIVPALARGQALPHRETADAIAFVIDDESALHEDFTSGYQNLACILQRVRGLSHCGVPYRIYLLSDLRRAEMPDYKVWLFPNLFQLDDARMALLREKVLRNGNLALFGPATGITDGRHLGAERASALLGVPMELHARSTTRHVVVQDFGHPITRELPANDVFGDSLAYGPTLAPGEWAVEQAGATPLGHANACWFIHRTGLFINEFGQGAGGNGTPGARGADDYAVVWSLALPLPARLLRACARYAGCHVWCEEDDVVFASESILCLHSMKAGPRVVKLPRPMRVTDLCTGKPYKDEPVTSIRLRVTPPDTRLFGLE
jgi:hypothetical protein